MSQRPLVVVTTSFPVAGDGSEAAGSFVADLVEELARHAPVRVVAPGSEAGQEQWSSRIEVHRYAAPARPLSTLKPWKPSDLAWLMRVLRGGARATLAAAGRDAGHILALWGLPCGEWARRAAETHGIGYSVWMLGSDVWSLGRIPLLRGALANVIRKADHAYADGYKLTEDAQRIAGTGRVRFLPSTRRIDLRDPPPPRSRPPYRLLFLGRWHPNKGVDLLLDALELLEQDDWERIERLEIQGGGAMEPLVRERVSVLRQAGKPVEAGNYLSKPEAEAAIARADWVLIPSRIESIPVVFSDAMKLGRPVVAMPVGDLPQLIKDADCGVCARSVDAEALAQGIRSALQRNRGDWPRGVGMQAARFDLQEIAGRIWNSLGQSA